MKVFYSNLDLATLYFVNSVQTEIGGSIFSENVVALWKKAEEDEFGHDPAMLKWAREGGDIPPVI